MSCFYSCSNVPGVPTHRHINTLEGLYHSILIFPQLTNGDYVLPVPLAFWWLFFEPGSKTLASLKLRTRRRRTTAGCAPPCTPPMKQLIATMIEAHICHFFAGNLMLRIHYEDSGGRYGCVSCKRVCTK